MADTLEILDITTTQAGGGSGYVSSVLTNASTISGDLSMPSPKSSYPQTGQAGNGYVKITILSEDAENSKIFENYGIGIYKDRECQSLITQRSNHVKIPESTGGLTFGGYYTERNGNGTKLIDEQGYLTDSFTNKYFTSNSTIYAYWVSESYTYNYTGYVQTAELKAGKYRLEVWGAEGGKSSAILVGGSGGAGGYAKGEIQLNQDTKLYIVVGEKGTESRRTYNGGGKGQARLKILKRTYLFTGSGGGATHIALSSGELYNLRYEKNNILIVAGGGGGAGVGITGISEKVNGGPGGGSSYSSSFALGEDSSEGRRRWPEDIMEA